MLLCSQLTSLFVALQPIDLEKEKLSMEEIIEKENTVKERRNSFIKDRLASLSHRRFIGRSKELQSLAAQQTLAQVERSSSVDVEILPGDSAYFDVEKVQC